MESESKFNSANGLYISQARQLSRFVFGDFFLKADRNDNRERFDIFLRDKIVVDIKGKKEVANLTDATIRIDGKLVNLLDYFKLYWNQKNEDGEHKKKNGFFHIIVLQQKIY